MRYLTVLSLLFLPYAGSYSQQPGGGGIELVVDSAADRATETRVHALEFTDQNTLRAVVTHGQDTSVSQIGAYEAFVHFRAAILPHTAVSVAGDMLVGLAPLEAEVFDIARERRVNTIKIEGIDGRQVHTALAEHAATPNALTNAPFGGTLPIMVNYQSADSVAGAAYYQVLVDGVPQTDTWTVYFWNGVTNVLIPVPPKTVGLSVGCYPVHPVAQLFDYQPPSLGDELDSTRFINGLHTIVLQFLDNSGNKLTPNLVSAPLTILVNNQSCVATLSPPVLNTTPTPTKADACGVLHYGKTTTTTVTLAYTATQPANFAFYSFALVRGVTPVGPPPPTLPSNAPVPATSPITATVADLLGTCPVAGFAAEVYVAATMTNGMTRQSQYDAEALMGFVLTP